MSVSTEQSQLLPAPERLRRMLNPTCAADYRLAVTWKELRGFRAGREYLADFHRRYGGTT